MIRKAAVNIDRIELVVRKDPDELTGFGLGGTSTARGGRCRAQLWRRPSALATVHSPSTATDLTVPERVKC